MVIHNRGYKDYTLNTIKAIHYIDLHLDLVVVNDCYSTQHNVSDVGVYNCYRFIQRFYVKVRVSAYTHVTHSVFEQLGA